MSKILVSGLINIETTLRIEQFPLQYSPVNYPFFGVSSSVSGVGYNLACALTTLGDEVPFLSLIGRDPAGELAAAALSRDGLTDRHILANLSETPQSVILYETGGKRQIHVDLKDIQEQTYPPERFAEALRGCQAAALCNINFSRALLPLAREAGCLVATDVHAISDLEDPYNLDFMRAANLLFMSHENLPASPEGFALQLLSRFGCEILVIGMGQQGAVLAVRRDHFLERIPAVTTRPPVNTIGAGDALFSAFLHSYAAGQNPYTAMEKAMVFASSKIGARGAAEGFLDAPTLDDLTAGLAKAA
jgi:ribokinase